MSRFKVGDKVAYSMNSGSYAEYAVVSEEISVFEKSLEITTENDSSTSTSTEDSILKKIQSK